MLFVIGNLMYPVFLVGFSDLSYLLASDVCRILSMVNFVGIQCFRAKLQDGQDTGGRRTGSRMMYVMISSQWSPQS